MPDLMICPKCGHEIRPGESVNIITLDGVDDSTRVVSGDAIFAHDKCPVAV